MRKHLENFKFEENDGYTISVLIALTLISILVVGYFALLAPIQKGYTTIYLLDTQEEAIDYPELLVIGQNSTFKINVNVENHMGETQACQVLLKLTNDPISSLPIETRANNSYEKTLENGETWKTPVTVTINEPGNYYVAFELWIHDQNSGTFQFTHNDCVLNLQVVDHI